jgi:hypothetical protein
VVSVVVVTAKLQRGLNLYNLIPESSVKIGIDSGAGDSNCGVFSAGITPCLNQGYYKLA